MITKIAATNLKGRTFSYDLEKINIIAGDNADGKSAVLDAVLLAALGYHPRLGKRNEDVFRLATGTEMSIRVENSDKQTATLDYWRDGEKIKSETSGELAECPPIMLDSKLYFELSPAKRIELVSELVDMPEAIKPARMLAEVKNIKLEKNSEHSEAVITTIVDSLRGITESNALKWLDAGLGSLRESLKLATANRKRMTAVVAGIEQLRATDENAVRQTRGVEARLAEARKKIAELQFRAGESGVTRMGIVTRNARRAFLGGIMVIQSDAHLEEESKLAQCLTEVNQLQKEIDGRLPVYEKARADIARRESEIAAHESVCGHLALSIKSLEKNMSETLKHKDCPTCGTSGTAWKAQYRTSVAQSVAQTKKAVQDRRNVIDQLAAQVLTLKNLLSEYHSLERELANAQKKLDELQKNRDAQAASGEACRNAQAELANLGAAENIVAIDTQIETLERSIVETQNIIDNCEVMQRELIAQRAQTKNQMQAIIEGQKLDAEIECLKAAGTLMKEAQAALVEKAFDALLVTVNKFTRTIIPLPILYSDGELGYQHESQWVSAATFSGAEESALFAGLSIALAARSKFKLVLVDELTRWIGASKERFIKQICKLVDDGTIDQFIGCDGVETVYKALSKTRNDFQVIVVK